MAKVQSLDANDLTVAAPKNLSATEQRGVAKKTPTAQMVPMQFRMSPDFAQAFREQAVRHRMKYNEFLEYCFAEMLKAARR